MCDPEICPECDAKSTLAAWLWTDTWGATGPALSDEDDAALDRIIDALDRHWVPGIDKSATVEAVRAEMADWVPRGATVQ